MASKAFLAALSNVNKTKNVETVLIGAGFLSEGDHDVTIQAVDTSDIDNNKVNVTYIDGQGQSYTDKMFTMSSDGSEFSYSLRMLWSGLIPNKEAVAKLFAAMAEDDRALEMFTGMKTRIRLAPGKGVQARATGTGKFAGYDVETNEVATEEHEDIKSVYNEVKAKNLKRSYLRITKVEATNSDANVAQLDAAIESRKAAASNGGVTGSSFKAGV